MNQSIFKHYYHFDIKKNKYHMVVRIFASIVELLNAISNSLLFSVTVNINILEAVFTLTA